MDAGRPTGECSAALGAGGAVENYEPFLTAGGGAIEKLLSFEPNGPTQGTPRISVALTQRGGTEMRICSRV